jgi:predicted AlkP superfamily phosphohydrolase/phosphomutase
MIKFNKRTLIITTILLFVGGIVLGLIYHFDLLSELKSQKDKVLFIGIDAADWDEIIPLVEAGKMPNMAKLIASGSRGSSETFHPTGSPLLWTTIATGVNSKKHGIVDFYSDEEREFTPNGAINIMASYNRKVKAIWNILSDFNKKVGIIGWWTTWPAEEVNGFMITNKAHLYYRGQVTEKATYPEELLKGGIGDLFKKTAEELTWQKIGVTKEEFETLQKTSDKGYYRWESIMRDRTNTKIAVNLLKQRKYKDLDFLAIYYDSSDLIQHSVLQYLISERDKIIDENENISQVKEFKEAKKEILDETTKQVKEISKQYDDGLIGDKERRAKIQELWLETKNKIADLHKSLNENSPVYLAEKRGEEAAQPIREVVDKVYQFIDQQIGELLEAFADENTTVIIASDHGFDYTETEDIEEKVEIPPGHQFSPDGIILLSGNHIKKGREITNGHIINTTPTILTLFGLPFALDMQGEPYVEVFEEKFLKEHRLMVVPTFETDRKIEPRPLLKTDDSAIIERLKAIGYW